MRTDIAALRVTPGDGVLKVAATVQLNLHAQNRRGRVDLIPGNMAAWSSSDAHVGEVNRQGRLTPRAPGAVTITVTYAGQKIVAAFTVVD